MPNDNTPAQLAQLSVRETHCRRAGDDLGADQARADWDALADRVPSHDWAGVHAAYRAALCDNRHE